MSDEINLYDYWQKIKGARKFIVIFVVVINIIVAIVLFRMPNIFKVEATLMPLGGGSSGGISSLVAQVGLGGLLGGSSGGGGVSSQIMAVLRSKTLAGRVIEKHDLGKVLYPTAETLPSLEKMIDTLRGKLKFKDDDLNHVILISMETSNPEQGVSLVNLYVQELAEYINQNTFSASKKNRLFIEKQLERNKTEYLELGKELNLFYGSNRISNTLPTLDVDVSQPAPPLGGDDAAGINPIKNSSSEIEAAKKKAALEGKLEETKAKVEKAKVVHDVPQQVYLEYLSLRRQLLGQVNILLSNQYEISKIEEAKEDLNFQVIDWAMMPTNKIKPLRLNILMTSCAVSLFLAIFLVFAADYLKSVGLLSKKS